MDIRPVNDEQSHAWALKEIERYFDLDPEPGIPEAARFDVLATLIEAYEIKCFPIAPAAPIDVIRFVMEQRGYRQADLAHLLGSRSRASEILSGRRRLTVEMIDLLSRKWKIPADLLVTQDHLLQA